MQRDFLVLSPDKVVNDVTSGGVTSPITEPLFAVVTEDDGARIVDSTIPL